MKYITVLSMLLLFSSSCSDDNFIKDNEKLEGEDFEFKSIEYLIGKDYEEIIELTLDTTIFENNTSLAQKLVSNPFANLSNVSSFNSDNDKIFHFIKVDPLYVRIPSYISNQHISLSKEMWLFSNQCVLQKPINEIMDTTIVEPYTRTSVVLYVIQRKYFTGFELTYLNKTTGAEETIEGKWEGIYLIGHRKEIVTKTIRL